MVTVRVEAISSILTVFSGRLRRNKSATPTKMAKTSAETPTPNIISGGIPLESESLPSSGEATGATLGVEGGRVGGFVGGRVVGGSVVGGGVVGGGVVGGGVW